MKRKVDLYKFIVGLQSPIPETFINSETGEVLDAYERSKLPISIQEKYVAINPKPIFKQQLEIVEDFFNQKENRELKKEIEAMSKRGIRDINLVHCYLEAVHRWEDFMTFQEESWKKSAIRWCQERNYEYYYKIPPFDPIMFEKILNDEDQTEFYHNRTKEYGGKLIRYKKGYKRLSVLEVDLKGKNVYNKTLFQVLEGINFNKYQWLIRKEEMIHKNESVKKSGIILTGTEFKKMICENEDTLIRIANIQAYPAECTPIEIDSFEELANSDCVFIILVDRNNLLEIYLRTKKTRKKLLENIEKQKMQYEIKEPHETGGFEIYV